MMFLSQKQDSRCKIPYYTEHFDIRTMKILSKVEAGQFSNGEECVEPKSLRTLPNQTDIKEYCNIWS